MSTQPLPEGSPYLRFGTVVLLLETGIWLVLWPGNYHLDLIALTFPPLWTLVPRLKVQLEIGVTNARIQWCLAFFWVLLAILLIFKIYFCRLIEFRTLHMPGKHSVTKTHPQSLFLDRVLLHRLGWTWAHPVSRQVLNLESSCPRLHSA